MKMMMTGIVLPKLRPKITMMKMKAKLQDEIVLILKINQNKKQKTKNKKIRSEKWTSK